MIIQYCLSNSGHEMLWCCIQIVNLFLDKVRIDCHIGQFINWHPAKDNIAVILVGHKLPKIGNVAAVSQLNQIVERNVMCLRSVPFPKTFFCPKKLAYLNVGTCFFLVFPDKAINGSFTDLYMTTGQ